MSSDESFAVAEKAERLYATTLQSKLEASDLNRFVAIEPDSGDYFVADSFSQAVAEARRKHPNRLSFVVRVGHEAAIHYPNLTVAIDQSE